MPQNDHSTLLSKLRAAREKWIDVGPIDLLLRRPTWYALASLSAQRAPDEAYLQAAIVDWRRVLEINLVPGGTAVEVPFDIDTCMELLEDQPELWSKARDAVREILRGPLPVSAAPPPPPPPSMPDEAAPTTAAEPQGDADA